MKSTEVASDTVSNGIVLPKAEWPLDIDAVPSGGKASPAYSSKSRYRGNARLELSGKNEENKRPSQCFADKPIRPARLRLQPRLWRSLPLKLMRMIQWISCWGELGAPVPGGKVWETTLMGGVSLEWGEVDEDDPVGLVL